MSQAPTPVKCFLAAFENREIDRELASRGFCRAILAFAIPELGILFRCRAEGTLVDLEFAALFALLKFLREDLNAEKIKTVEVLSSNPEFVFAFTGKTRHLAPDSERMRLLTEYGKHLKISVGYIEPLKNQALVPAIDYPSLPQAASLDLKSRSDYNERPRFQPFQRGIKF